MANLFATDVEMRGNRVTGAGDPVAPSDTATKSYVDTAVGWTPVADRADTYHATDGTNTTPQWVTTASRFGRTVHRVSNPGAGQVSVRLSNWATMPAGAGTGEVAGPNAVTVRCSIEYPAGVWRQVSGSTAWSSSATYQPGDQVTTSAGSVAWVCTATSTGNTPAAGSAFWAPVTRYPVNFAGQATNRVATIAAGADVVSLPVFLAAPLADGTRIAVSTQMSSGSSSGKIPPCDNIGGWDFAVDYPTSAPAAAADLVDLYPTTQTPMAQATGSTAAPGSAATPTWDAAANKLPRPVVIMGNAPGRRWTALVGDSLLMAYGDAFVDGWQRGFAGRAWAQAGMPHARITQGGDRMQYLQPANAARRLALARQAPTILCSAGANDMSNGRTLAQLQADAQACWTALAAGGGRVFAMTVFPQSTSTDSWATVANQTPRFAAGSVRDTYNAWLRGGASMQVDGATVTAGQVGHPLAGVVDVSAAFEVPGDPTRIVVNGQPNYSTLDGAHPTAAVNQIIADALTPNVPRVVNAVPALHASTHAAGAADPLTPAAIGAADVATLGGYVNPIAGIGALSDFLIYGDRFSTVPRTANLGQYDVANRRKLIALLGQCTADTVNGAKINIHSNSVGAITISAYLYWGRVADFPTMQMVGSGSMTTAAGATGEQLVPFSSPVAIPGNGYLGLIVVLSAGPVVVGLVQGASGVAASFVNPGGNIVVNGFLNTTTAPATPLTWTVAGMGGGVTLVSNRAWTALY